MTEVTTEAGLRALLGEPMPQALAKERRALHELDRQWLAASRFCLVATSDTDGGCDVSPKGDPAGFTLVLDDRTIARPVPRDAVGISASRARPPRRAPVPPGRTGCA